MPCSWDTWCLGAAGGESIVSLRASSLHMQLIVAKLSPYSQNWCGVSDRLVSRPTLELLVTTVSGFDSVVMFALSAARTEWRAMRGENCRFTRPFGNGGLFAALAALAFWPVSDNWRRAAGPGAAELCAPDRATLRYLPHRFPCTDALWTTIQAARLYDGRRSVPDHAVLVQHRD